MRIRVLTAALTLIWYSRASDYPPGASAEAREERKAFAWSGLTPGGRRSLWLSTEGTTTIVNGNVDNDAAVEFQLAIDDAHVAASAYRVLDFIL